MGTVTFWNTANPHANQYLYIEDTGNDYVDSVRLSEDQIIDMLKYINKYMPDIIDKALEDNC